MAGRSKTAIAAVVALALTTVVATSSAADAASTTGRHALGTKLFGSALRERSGAVRIKAPIAGLTQPSGVAPSFLGAVATFKNRYLLKTGAPSSRAARVDRPRLAGVAISGTFDVVGQPRSPSEFVIVIACQGRTTFGYFCGTQAHPAWEASTQSKPSSPSKGTYNFGRIPASASGWRIGMILLNGVSNAGYYPSSAGVLVAAKGSRKSVKRAISMKFVTPEILATFRVGGAPKGYQFLFAAIVCPSSVTPDQLGFYEQNGNCGITEGLNTQQIGIYATPGRWTVRYVYEPSKTNVVMVAPQDVITKDFSVTGPRLSLNTLSSRAVANVSSSYVKPSVTGSVSGQFLDPGFFAALSIVDVATNTEAVGVLADPFVGSTSFDAFLDAGTYVSYAEVEAPFPDDQFAQVAAAQVVLTKLGSNFDVGLSVPTLTRHYSILPVAETIGGTVSVPGLPDLSNASGWDNVLPFSFVQVCPSASFSLECSGGFVVSPSKLLGGGFTLYGITGVASTAFVYTDLAGNVVIGPSVTSPASASFRSVTLTAPYHVPTFWGNVTVSGDNGFELWALWIQACPSSEKFSISCAGGISQAVNNFLNIFPPQTGSFKVGYAIDLPPGTWRIAAAGSTFTSESPQQLGPAVMVDVATTYPDVNLTAKA